MKIAVTGAKGQLGSELVRRGCIPVEEKFITVEFWRKLEEISPDTIINCGAMTDVDECEEDAASIFRATDSNATYIAPIILKGFKGYFVQISTDYIFDGQNGPYSPNDPPNPLSIYGWSKLGGELITRRYKGPWLIIRTTVLFSQSENNFVYKIVKQLEQGKQVTLYQPGLIGTPTYVPDLAKEIMRVVNAEYTGIAHIAGNRILTRLRFARMIAKEFGFNPSDITPSDDKPTGAPRPLRAGLFCDHSGYLSVNSHNPKDGLKELAERYKRGEIWK